MAALEKILDKIKFLEANVEREKNPVEKARMKGEIAALKLVVEKKLCRKNDEALAEVRGISSGAQKAIGILEKEK